MPASMCHRIQSALILFVSLIVLMAIVFTEAAPANDVPMRMCGRKLINTLSTVCQKTVCSELEVHHEAKNPAECCAWGCTYSQLQDICCS